MDIPQQIFQDHSGGSFCYIICIFIAKSNKSNMFFFFKVWIPPTGSRLAIGYGSRSDHQLFKFIRIFLFVDYSLFPVRDTPLSPGKDDIKSKRCHIDLQSTSCYCCCCNLNALNLWKLVKKKWFRLWYIHLSILKMVVVQCRVNS